MSETFSWDAVAPEGGGFAKWETPGDRFAGIIRNPRFLNNNFASEGGPAKFFAVDLDNDGVLTTLKFDKADLRRAVKKAGQDVGVDGIAEGDFLEVVYTGDGEPVRADLNPPKLFDAVYVPAGAEWGGG